MKNSLSYAGWSCRGGASSLGETWVSQRGKQEIPDAAALARLDAAYAAASRPVWEDLLTRYRIIKDTPLAFFPGKEEECSHLYGQLMEAYLEHPDPSRADMALECYLYEWRDIDSDFSDMPDTLWAKSVVARWQEEEDHLTHTWQSLTPEQSAHRHQLITTFQSLL